MCFTKKTLHKSDPGHVLTAKKQTTLDRDKWIRAGKLLEPIVFDPNWLYTAMMVVIGRECKQSVNDM